MTTNSRASHGALFALPLEIREIIYGYLTPSSRLPTVLRSRHLGVSSVSHRPPPVNALLACRQLCAEALDVYYRKCVFKFDGLLDPANIWPLWQIEEVLGGSDLGRVALVNMRKVELNLFWHRLPDGGIEISSVDGKYGSLALSEGDKRKERLDRAVQVLRQAEQLRSVILTWKEIPHGKDERPPNDWALRENVLQSLGAIGGARVVIGDIVASDEVESSILALVEHVNSLRSSEREYRGRVASRAYLDLVETAEGSFEAAGHTFKRRSYFD